MDEGSALLSEMTPAMEHARFQDELADRHRDKDYWRTRIRIENGLSIFTASRDFSFRGKLVWIDSTVSRLRIGGQATARQLSFSDTQSIICRFGEPCLVNLTISNPRGFPGSRMSLPEMLQIQ